MNRQDLPRPAKGFCVNAELKMNPDRGIGVFAAEFIPASLTLSCVTQRTTQRLLTILTTWRLEGYDLRCDEGYLLQCD